MWVKVTLSFAIVAFCTLLGYLAAGKYRSRKKFYAQFSAFNERYLNELDYSRKPFCDFLNAYPYSGEFHTYLKNFAKERAGGRVNCLLKDEQAELDDYFSMLGRGDAQSQREFFLSRKGRLFESSEVCAKEAKTRGELYTKLGLLAGLAFVILIV